MLISVPLLTPSILEPTSLNLLDEIVLEGEAPILT